MTDELKRSEAVQKRNEEIIKLYESRWPYHAIADKFNVSYQVVEKVLREYKRGIGQVRLHKGMGSIKPLFKPRNDAILELLKGGKSVEEIAIQLETTQSAIYHVAKNNGVEIKKIKHPRKHGVTTGQVIELSTNNITNAQIAKLVGVSPQRVQQIIARHKKGK